MSAPRPLAHEAYQRIISMIFEGALKSGDLLQEAVLGEVFGMSRTPVREAIKRLESEHLAVTYPRRGTFATPVDITALSEISQVREVLEPLAARTAAARRGGREREQLEALVQELSTLSDDELRQDNALRWDLHVHRAVYAAAGNAHLQATLERYSNLATRIWCVAADRVPQLRGHIDIHTTLLRAVLDGDEETATEVMRHHVQDFEEQIRQVL